MHNVAQDNDPKGDGEIESELSHPVGPDELNAWRRGFTPQAEIWNGRLAMLGISMGIAALLLIRLVTHP
ncbi:high light inducible protein [Synechococcus sp. Cruz CV-v-12]|uniref:high light inducible protein n=1 Tax=unclassified Synechococcus TaxID=2626047 RepID=UPI0037D99858